MWYVTQRFYAFWISLAIGFSLSLLVSGICRQRSLYAVCPGGSARGGRCAGVALLLQRQSVCGGVHGTRLVLVHVTSNTAPAVTYVSTSSVPGGRV
jgi:hypothetical protein